MHGTPFTSHLHRTECLAFEIESHPKYIANARLRMFLCRLKTGLDCLFLASPVQLHKTAALLSLQELYDEMLLGQFRFLRVRNGRELGLWWGRSCNCSRNMFESDACSVHNTLTRSRRC
eukprot:6176484-Pleurochrysis_carterae.AAC.5